MSTKCENCPLRRLPLFETFSNSDVAFMAKFKTGELTAQAGTDIFSEGSATPQLYTVLSGMGLRHKTTEDGKRQVVGFAMPGDFLGLQSGVMGEMGHSFEATTDMKLCVFNRAELWSLFKSNPARAFDLTHLAAREENILGEALTVMGQEPAIARVAWALLRFDRRLKALDLARNGRVPLPYRQQDMAEALGLSVVHTNKTLAKLRKSGVATWEGGQLDVHRPADLAKLAGDTVTDLPPRPLI